MLDESNVDQQEALGIIGVNLLFGAFDLTGTPSRHLWGDRDLVISSPEEEFPLAAHLGALTCISRPEMHPELVMRDVLSVLGDRLSSKREVGLRVSGYPQ